MRAGRLDRTILIQRQSETQNDAGDVVQSWATLAQRPASCLPLRGEERSAAPQWVAREQVEFRIHFDSTVNGITPKDRIVYPASADSPPDTVDGALYDIMAVHELGRREGYRILAARRTDAG